MTAISIIDKYFINGMMGDIRNYAYTEDIPLNTLLKGFDLKNFTLTFFLWMCNNGYIEPEKTEIRGDQRIRYFDYISPDMYPKIGEIYKLYRESKCKNKRQLKIK